MTFNQHYEKEYRTEKTITQIIVLVSGQIQEIKKQVTDISQAHGEEGRTNHFEPFRFLNLSVGLERMVNRRHYLTIEPYYKYPLGSISSEQLRFSTIELMNFTVCS